MAVTTQLLGGFGLTLQVAGPAALVEAVVSDLTAVGPMVNGEPDRRYDIVPAPGGKFVLRCEGASFTGLPSSSHDVLTAVREDVAAFVAERSRTHAFVHAGVVGWRGRAVVIPGRTRSGKTSLVAALLRAGATYLSDEYAPFDATGSVRPYPRPLTVRPPGGGLGLPVAAADLGADVAAAPMPVGWLLLTSYDETGRWDPVERPSGAALLSLLDNAVGIRSNPDLVVPVLARVAARATVLESPRGDADETARLVLRRLGGATCGISAPARRCSTGAGG